MMSATVDRLDPVCQRERMLHDELATNAYNATQAPIEAIVDITERQRKPMKHGVPHHAKKGATRHSPGAMHYSLPSEEKEGILPGESTDGVGALPGMLDDTSVVKLPLEREDPDPYSHPRAPTEGAALGEHPIVTTTNVVPHAPFERPKAPMKRDARHLAKKAAKGAARAAGLSTEPGHWSLPSQEKEGLHPGESTGGCGPLPFTLDDTSVAKLPLEREDPDPYSHPHAPLERSEDHTKHSLRHAKKAAKGTTGLSSEPVHYSMPSEEKEGLQPGESTGGCGPLPFKLDDTSVAKLPLEREDPDPYSHPHAPLERSEDHRKHSLRHAKKAAKGTTGLSSEPVHYSMPSEEKEGLQPGESTGGCGPLPGMLDDTSVAKLPLEREDPDPYSHERTTRPTQTESHGKHHLMEKIRGEMKVLTGHLTGHRAKTEEGKALKKGASTAH